MCLNRVLQEEKKASRAAVAVVHAHSRAGAAAAEIDEILSQQRQGAERDKAAALAGLKALYHSELAVRESAVRELRRERDTVMASVRQRDAALQVVP
jgi:ADP-ribosylglycohydrolase